MTSPSASPTPSLWQRLRDSKRFRERSPLIVGVVTIVALVVAVLGALNFSKLPLVGAGDSYQADFASAGGLQTGDLVTVAGVREGTVTGMALNGNRVRISFTLSSDVHAGSSSTVSTKVLNPLGQEYLEVDPAGSGQLDPNVVIPTSRTSAPSTLVGDLSQLTDEVGHYDISQLIHSLQVGTQDLQGTPQATTAAALSGLARFSQVIADRQQQLADIINQSAQLTGVLSQRSNEIVNLVGQSDLVLQVLNQRRQAIDQLLVTTTALSNQLSSLVGGNRSQLDTLLSNLQVVSGVLSRDSSSIGQAIPLLAAFNRYAANVTGSGRFADVVIPTLLVPDNAIKQCGTSPPVATALGCPG